MNRRDFLASAGAAAIVPFVPRWLDGEMLRTCPVIKNLKTGEMAWSIVMSARSYRKWKDRPLATSPHEPIMYIYLHTNVRYERYPNSTDQGHVLMADLYFAGYYLGKNDTLISWFAMEPPISTEVDHIQEEHPKFWTFAEAMADLLMDTRIKPNVMPRMRQLCKVALQAPKGRRPGDLVHLVRRA
jgi:hypothetical protein